MRALMASNLAQTSTDSATSGSPLASESNKSKKMNTTTVFVEAPQDTERQHLDAVLAAINSFKAESLARHREVIDGIAQIGTDLDA
ncbi:hypothetical protein NHX12_025282 [Muraenolepis orangiensis]|uniref:Uncharacterized protein n=1 Tax=Muraenolepis orangiensis TaxID=630683 RepID=A0A9Q0IPH9_9TELE|nr:hypothetical protein NHX12_025282 [Muraenolepis orangiensis]